MGLLSSIKQRRAVKAKGPKAEMHPITVRDEPPMNFGGSSRTVMGCISAVVLIFRRPPPEGIPRYVELVSQPLNWD